MIEFEDLPLLRDPILIAAFEGWNDAGETASATLAHLINMWQARVIAALDPEDYYDFQVARPRVTGEPGEREVTWPSTRIFLAQDTPLGRDVLLVQGSSRPCGGSPSRVSLLEFITDTDVSMVITLGGLLADVPHTRPIPITVTSDSQDTRERYDVESSKYEGPTGIVGVLTDAAHRAGVATLSCWAAVPHYAGGSPSPKATLALINRLEEPARHPH